MSVLRGGYYYSGGADYAIADAVAGLDHGVNRFLFGIRVRLVQDRVMLGGVEVLALFAELLDTELLEGLVNLGGDGLERVVHLAVFANAVDIVEGGQQRGQHVDDAVLAEALLLLLRAIAVVDELRTFALQGFEVVCGFLLGLAERGEGVCGIGLAFASLLSLSCGRSRVGSFIGRSLGSRILRRAGLGGGASP